MARYRKKRPSLSSLYKKHGRYMKRKSTKLRRRRTYKKGKINVSLKYRGTTIKPCIRKFFYEVSDAV